MSAIKIRRYQASESDFAKGARTRTEISVPASAGITDLTQSKLILDMHMNLSDASGAVLLPVTFGNQQMVGGPQALIRNAAVVSAQHGILNERRQQNVISANLDWYLKSRAQEDQAGTFGNSTNTNYGVDRMNLLPDNPFLLYKRPSDTTGDAATVTEAAVTRRAELPVAWKHIDNFGDQMPQFPNVAFGGSIDYRVEFEDQMNVVFPAKMPFSQGEPCDARSAVSSRLGNSDAPLTLTKATTQYFRPPQQGDVCTVYFRQVTTGNTITPATSGMIDEIASVTTVGTKYVVTLKNGFATTGATESCANIVLFYFCNTDLLGPGVKPLAIANACTGSSNLYGSAAAPLVFPKNSPGGIQTSKANDAVTIDSINTIPWYVGAPVVLTGSLNDASGALIVQKETTISSVAINGDDVQIVLTEPYNDATAPSGGGGTVMTAPSLAYRDSKAGTKFTCTWAIDEVYAELHQLQLTPQQLSKVQSSMSNMEIPFIDQMLVQRNMPSNSSAHTEVLQALANTVGLAVLTPQNLTFLSGFDNCGKYRFALNGKETCNQDIVVGGADLVGRQLHNYFLKVFFGNLGQSLKKYDAPKCDYVNTNDQETHSMFPLIIPNLPTEQVVQLQLFANDGTYMNGKNLYYLFFRQRVMRISNGRVQLSA